MMKQLKIYWDRTFTNWPYRLILHIGFWGFFLSSWLDETMVVSITLRQHYLVTLIGTLFVIYLYYTLAYLITPLFKSKKWFWGILAFIVYYIIAIILRTYHIELIMQWYNFHRASIQGGEFWQNLSERQLNPSKFLPVIFSGLSSLIVIIYIPLTIKFLRYAYMFNEKQTWIVKENAQLQLNTLKAQINPHFFFNTLNNLQSFIVQNEKEKSVELLNRLADFMRSSLYDGDKEYISMEKEVELINNYINIEKVRFENDVLISYNINNNYPNYQIPPFLFLPFIENVFKHGGQLPTNQIHIHIALSNTADRLILSTSNTFLIEENKQDLGGIGLINVRKRLDYYFPNRYQLDISTLANVFTVNLEIYK
jgi:two-component system LytT family sensor kinase